MNRKNIQEFAYATCSNIYIVREIQGHFVKILRGSISDNPFQQTHDNWHLDFSGDYILLIRVHQNTMPMLQYSGVTLYKRGNEHFLYKINSISLQAFGGFLNDGIVGRELISKNWCHFSFPNEEVFDSYCLASQSRTKLFRATVYVPSDKDQKACIATLLQVQPVCSWCSGAHTIRRKVYDEETSFVHFPGEN